MQINEIIDPHPNQMELPLQGGTSRMNSKQIAAWRGQMCTLAQTVYDEWDQSGAGGDPELGFGGICDLIADQICSVLGQYGVECMSMNTGDTGENHTSVLANLSDGVFEVDIPPHVYETGGGYTWHKRSNVRFEPGDVVISRIERPMSDDEFAQRFER